MVTTIGVIGTGSMGSALVKGWLRTGEQGVRLIVWDKVEAAMQNVLIPGPVSAAKSVEDLVGRADVVLLVVKPKDAPDVLRTVASRVRPEQQVISAMAGVTLEQIRALLGPEGRLFRVMPNLGVELGVGAIAVAAEPGTREAETQGIVRLFSGLGVTESFSESELDAVTAVSGSGPAFLALAVESLEDGAVASGLPRATARRLVRQSALSLAGALPLAETGPGTGADPTLSAGAAPDAARGETRGPDLLGEAQESSEESTTRSAFRLAVESAVERARVLRRA
jgi:pyrroline-5-carboxylate reductase